jgi:predicted dehydrogenase
MDRALGVRWGILSTARINLPVLAAARVSDRFDVVAVASREQLRADAYAQEHGIERAHGTYEALLEDPEVDAVYNSLPNSMHVDWTIRALEAGKHVLCEKPFDRKPGAVERAFDVAERHGLVLMEAFMWRHHPQTTKLAEVVRSGRIGEPRVVLARFSFPLANTADIRMRPELDGGALMDLGCYCVSASRLIGGEPVLVLGHQLVGPTGVDVRFNGMLEFPGRVFAQFTCGMDMPFSRRLEVVGSDTSAVLEDPWGGRDPHVQVGDERVDVEDADRYQLELENMCDAIRGEAEPLLGRDDAVGQARTIAALYRSAESGAAVPL